MRFVEYLEDTEKCKEEDERNPQSYLPEITMVNILECVSPIFPLRVYVCVCVCVQEQHYRYVCRSHTRFLQN